MGPCVPSSASRLPRQAMAGGSRKAPPTAVALDRHTARTRSSAPRLVRQGLSPWPILLSGAA
eukprot:7391533-Lingulodinium_polyedra.AAC.1